MVPACSITACEGFLYLQGMHNKTFKNPESLTHFRFCGGEWEAVIWSLRKVTDGIACSLKYALRVCPYKCEHFLSFDRGRTRHVVGAITSQHATQTHTHIRNRVSCMTLVCRHNYTIIISHYTHTRAYLDTAKTLRRPDFNPCAETLVPYISCTLSVPVRDRDLLLFGGFPIRYGNIKNSHCRRALSAY